MVHTLFKFNGNVSTFDGANNRGIMTDSKQLQDEIESNIISVLPGQ